MESSKICNFGSNREAHSLLLRATLKTKKVLVQMKVYGIGLSKTGTSSLTEAFKILNFKSIHNPSQFLNLDEQGHLSIDFNRLEIYEAATDLEIAFFFEELDVRFPNSKFILTTREIGSWLKSCENHFNDDLQCSREEKALLEKVYGTSIYNKDK